MCIYRVFFSPVPFYSNIVWEFIIIYASIEFISVISLTVLNFQWHWINTMQFRAYLQLLQRNIVSVCNEIQTEWKLGMIPSQVLLCHPFDLFYFVMQNKYTFVPFIAVKFQLESIALPVVYSIAWSSGGTDCCPIIWYRITSIVHWVVQINVNWIFSIIFHCAV